MSAKCFYVTVMVGNSLYEEHDGASDLGPDGLKAEVPSLGEGISLVVNEEMDMKRLTMDQQSAKNECILKR